MIFSPDDYISLKQTAAQFPAWTLSHLKKIAALGTCPAMIRIKTSPENKYAKTIVIKPLFEIWMLRSSSEFSEVMQSKKDAINSFLESLTKKEPGRPRELKIAGGKG